jgi:hypothetical protein
MDGEWVRGRRCGPEYEDGVPHQDPKGDRRQAHGNTSARILMPRSGRESYPADVIEQAPPTPEGPEDHATGQLGIHVADTDTPAEDRNRAVHLEACYILRSARIAAQDPDGQDDLVGGGVQARQRPRDAHECDIRSAGPVHESSPACHVV